MNRRKLLSALATCALMLLILASFGNVGQSAAEKQKPQFTFLFGGDDKWKTFDGVEQSLPKTKAEKTPEVRKKVWLGHY